MRGVAKGRQQTGLRVGRAASTHASTSALSPCAAPEPVFGITKRVMGWRQMNMRGLDKANVEWSLVTMARNIKRMHVLRAA